MSKRQSDAMKVAGLAGILQSANKEKVKETPPSPALPIEVAPQVEAPAAAPKKTRSVGKKSDPNYSLHGLYVRNDTYKAAKRRLEDTQPDKDMSDLAEELFRQWLESSD
jgi:hypothetical protein